VGLNKFFIFGSMMILCSGFSSSRGADLKTPEENKLKAELIVKLKDAPWAIEFTDEDTALITLKKGDLLRLDLKTKKTSKINGAPASTIYGQGGLLDLMLHPDFDKNKTLYFSYTKKVVGGYTTAVAKGVLEKNAIKNLKEFFVANNPSTKSQHFGSRMVHDGKGHLYFTMGERGVRDLAQDLAADQGKVHRLKLDGSTPKDNPFFNKKNAQKTIWSYGHRNPQGLVYDFKKNLLYEQEHGPKGGDEINIILKGANYGWPKVTYGKEYYGPKISDFKTKKGFEDPLYQFTPSIAPSSLELYKGGDISFLNNKLISGALALTHLNVLDISDEKSIKEFRYFDDMDERVRDVKQSPKGALYFLTDSGGVYLVRAKK
jgi:glucose/arabinose dehydrogenase